MGAIALHPMVCSFTGLVAEVQLLGTVLLPLLTVSPIQLVTLGNHEGVCLALASESHHQLWWTWQQTQ